MSWLTDPLLNESLPDKYRSRTGLSQTNSGASTMEIFHSALVLFSFAYFYFFLSWKAVTFHVIRLINLQSKKW